MVWEFDLETSLLQAELKYLIRCGNITIYSLSHKDSIHISETEAPGWGFYQLTRSGGDGGLWPLH